VRAVVDSSVLISAFLRPGPLHDVISAARAGRFALCLSSRLLDETRRGLLKARNQIRYRYEPREVEAFVASVAQLAAVISELAAIEPVCRDPDADHVLGAALAVDADWIVTGDGDLLSLGSYGRTRILSVRAFLAEV
jgi:putative PIN family toxin of toxin-antitoxin system